MNDDCWISQLDGFARAGGFVGNMRARNPAVANHTDIVFFHFDFEVNSGLTPRNGNAVSTSLVVMPHKLIFRR